MSAEWAELHAALLRALSRRTSAEQFASARDEAPTLARFRTIGELCRYLDRRATSQAELDEKDQLFAVLVNATQTHSFWAELAHLMLWYGMWPALHGIYVRRVARSPASPDEVVAQIAAAFTDVVAGMALGQVNRISSTLKRSTERAIRSTSREERADRHRRVSPADASHRDAEFAPATSLGDESESPAAARGQVVPIELEQLAAEDAPSLEAALRSLRGRLAPLLGRDTDLVLAAVVLESEPRWIADQLELSQDATRKRLQRALMRARALGTRLASKLRS